MSGIVLDIREHVARIVIDRPERLNALDQESNRALEAAWTEIEARSDVRVAVITGAGTRSFCVGMDMKDAAGTGLDYWLRDRPGGAGGIGMRSSLTVPVIARVNGYALGGGFEMVLGCDIAVAARSAQFGLTEPRVGQLGPEGIVQIVRQIPRKWAMEMLLTGKKISAEEAARVGLVNEVVPDDELDAAIDRWVGHVLACAPLSLRATKEIVNSTGHMTAREAEAARLPLTLRALQSEDGREGIRAFREKRAPRWTGR